MTDQPRIAIPGGPSAQDAILSSGPPRATAFIVTIYGDAVAPRGGVLSMRSLIDTGAAHGLSESLVRTAVSRLVGAGRLAGERVGRTSFYRLTEAAEAEFAAAARVLYDPPAPATGWLFAMIDAPPGEGWTHVATGLCAAPDRSDITRPDALTFASEVIAGAADMPGFAARHWPLDEVADAYRAFLGRYARLLADPVALADASPETALALRLRLVHAYRAAALADPRVPAAALPGDWPGGPARAVFVKAYLALSDAADAEIARRLEDAQGALLQETSHTQARLQRLRRESITHL